MLKGNLDCLKSLMKFRAHLWIKNKHGDYPIHETINALSDNKPTNDASQIIPVIRYVFQLYPNQINIRNNEHRTPLHLAASAGDINICAILIEYGAKVNSLLRTLSVSLSQKLPSGNDAFI
jgi:ankyrin repeat protein